MNVLSSKIGNVTMPTQIKKNSPSWTLKFGFEKKNPTSKESWATKYHAKRSQHIIMDDKNY